MQLAKNLLLALALLALAFAVELIPPVRALTDYLDRHPEPWLTLTIAATVVGWLLFAGAVLVGILAQGRPLSAGEARAQAGFRRGAGVGREFQMTRSFSSIKDAFRSGAWRRDPDWYPIFLGLAAMPLILYGMFGIAIVLGPPLVKALCAGALLYATVMLVRSFWKA